MSVIQDLLGMRKTLGLSPRTQKEVTDPHCCFNHFCGLEQYLVHHRTMLNTVKHLHRVSSSPKPQPKATHHLSASSKSSVCKWGLPYSLHSQARFTFRSEGYTALLWVSLTFWALIHDQHLRRSTETIFLFAFFNSMHLQSLYS